MRQKMRIPLYYDPAHSTGEWVSNTESEFRYIVSNLSFRPPVPMVAAMTQMSHGWFMSTVDRLRKMYESQQIEAEQRDRMMRIKRLYGDTSNKY